MDGQRLTSFDLVNRIRCYFRWLRRVEFPLVDEPSCEPRFCRIVHRPPSGFGQSRNRNRVAASGTGAIYNLIVTGFWFNCCRRSPDRAFFVVAHRLNLILRRHPTPTPPHHPPYAKATGGKEGRGFPRNSGCIHSSNMVAEAFYFPKYWRWATTCRHTLPLPLSPSEALAQLCVGRG